MLSLFSAGVGRGLPGDWPNGAGRLLVGLSGFALGCR
jgi:hypothetical protein